LVIEGNLGHRITPSPTDLFQKVRRLSNQRPAPVDGSTEPVQKLMRYWPAAIRSSSARMSSSWRWRHDMPFRRSMKRVKS
jgi:hypothetical protein